MERTEPTEATTAVNDSDGTLVRVEGLKKQFPISAGLFRRSQHFVHAVDDVSFQIAKGEIFGLVGESGCGKTTTGKLLVKLMEPTAGEIHLKDINLTTLDGNRLKQFRREVQMIFQDPYESMDPRQTIFDIVSEPLSVHNIGRIDEREDRVAEFLRLVGLTPPGTFLFRYPHELSGGQRQRVAIARALILEPSFIVADEPTSMLDVSVQTGVMQLMLDLRNEFDIGYLYITHDLAVARYLCDRIAVMYLGKIVEMGETEEVIQNPLHPYTRALISAVPVPDPKFNRERLEIKGGVTQPIDPHPRCRFYDRCPISVDYCRVSDHPPLEEKRDVHYVACYEVR
ncbi:MAG: ABC transporter ATP-binding protein [Candidatus Bipolaricaulia bacterium]